MIVKSEAVVLKSIKYGDTSKIITLLTKDFGKISVIAKGARKPKNKFGSSLNPLSYINVQFYLKTNRDLQILNNSDIITHFTNLDTNYESLVTALILAEFINNVTESKEVNEEIFFVLVETLKLIDKNITKAYIFVLKALIQLAEITGFAVNFHHFDDSLENIVFSIEDGRPILTLPHNNSFYNLKIETMKKLNDIQNLKTNYDVSSLEISKETFIESINFFLKYFNFHLDKNFSLKSLNLLQQL